MSNRIISPRYLRRLSNYNSYGTNHRTHAAAPILSPATGNVLIERSYRAELSTHDVAAARSAAEDSRFPRGPRRPLSFAVLAATGGRPADEAAAKNRNRLFQIARTYLVTHSPTYRSWQPVHLLSLLGRRLNPPVASGPAALCKSSARVYEPPL